MKEIYVIVVAFLAFSAVNAEHLDRDQDQNEVAYNIPTVCPYPSEEFPENTTTNLPHEHNCSRFYKCFIGSPVSQECPLMYKDDPVTRLHYNSFLQVCDWPWTAGCESCPRKYANGTYPPATRINHESGNCQYFYECIYGVPYLRYCPTNTCFSRTCQTCVDKNQPGGRCETYPRPPTAFPPASSSQPTYIPTSSKPTLQPGCRNGDTIKHPCDCAKYYSCSDNDLYLAECKGGLHYSPAAKGCLPPNEAGCFVPKK
ncbi:hypothetical protein PUN28_013387 [Cardiocondyla obscurior]|uniref:Chitin-binding type-2 domain-containing protein n=1 Tax=Cardiocondyla obscurior TaxID=286306 RepID=A0AAW2FA72_9HYME